MGGQKYFFCQGEKKNCSFRILDFQIDMFVCNFYDKKWDKSSLRRACEWIQKENTRLELIRKNANKRTLQMLRNIQIGDILFCTARSKEVKLTEKPTEFSQIARVKCRKSDGTIVEIPAYNLRKISNGNYYGDFFIEGKENEKKAKELEIYAKYYGFRAEFTKNDKGFLLKIYGDSQQEVDDFITLSLEQDFDISQYL